MENNNEKIITNFYYDPDKGMINNPITLYNKIKKEFPNIKL